MSSANSARAHVAGREFQTPFSGRALKFGREPPSLRAASAARHSGPRFTSFLGKPRYRRGDCEESDLSSHLVDA